MVARGEIDLSVIEEPAASRVRLGDVPDPGSSPPA
ncbi:hypothetical protein QF026_004064 [Streptomyces aurantiacus]|nr:hypothetical protein [Streptomyces aurantiacus]